MHYLTINLFGKNGRVYLFKNKYKLNFKFWNHSNIRMFWKKNDRKCHLKKNCFDV